MSLRILHVTPYAEGAWAYGGIPRLTSTLTRALARRGHHVTVCSTDACSADARLPKARADDDVALRVFPNVSNHLAYHWQCFTPLGFGAYMREHARTFDVAHLHACRNLPGAIAARHLRRAGIPYVLAPNGTAPLIERRRLAKRIFDLAWGNTVTRHAHRILAVTEAERRQLHEAGVEDFRIRLVANPIDLDEFSTPLAPGAFKARHGLSGPLVVYLGKITPRKRVDMLVRAFAQLHAPSATLVIAGNDMGAEASARAAAETTGVTGRTRFVGLLQGAARLELLADADVVVYPSEHEIFGLVPLEALLVGTPVVVSDDSGCAEVVRQVGGGLVVPGRETDLARAIDTVLERPAEWQAAARSAADGVRVRFGAETIGARLEELYGEMMRTPCPH